MPENIPSRARREMLEQQKALQETGPYMTLGIQLVITILAFFGIGYWLDHHFHSGSLWMIIFTSFGVVSSLTYFIVTVIGLQKKEDRKLGKTETKVR
ncbi:MAG TPA: AtpZ/AtpI family protein [Candidatus Kapabacteria bacterium]|jgi:F0F1-type ATP synthase assembly protein I